jgi:predicted nucleic acid-binding Zn ribbon protein
LDLKQYLHLDFPLRSQPRLTDSIPQMLESALDLRRTMEPVRTGLRNIMRDLLRSRPAEEAVVLAWPIVCGKEVAERARAASFKEGVLTVEVSDVAWREQLGSFGPRYVSGFNELLGPLVKEVRFRVSH